MSSGLSLISARARVVLPAGMDSDWLTGLLVVLMVTIAVGLLWSGTMFGELQ